MGGPYQFAPSGRTLDRNDAYHPEFAAAIGVKSEPPRSTSLHTYANLVHERADRMQKLAMQARDLADVLGGAQPEGTGSKMADNPRPAANGLLEDFHNGVMRLECWQDHVEGYLSRLSQLIIIRD